MVDESPLTGRRSLTKSEQRLLDGQGVLPMSARSTGENRLGIEAGEKSLLQVYFG